MSDFSVPSATVSDVIAAYLRHCAIEAVHGEVARLNRARTFAWFCNRYGSMAVNELKAFHLTDFIEARPSWRSVSTRRANANMIRAAFQWAADDERIARNPFRKVRYPEAERRPDMPDDVLERIIQAASKPFERFLRFLRLTGCRIGEAHQAVWADVDLIRGMWTIPKHKTRKITGKAKRVALVAEAVVMLRQMAPFAKEVEPDHASRSFRPCGPIFLNTAGQPWNSGSLEMALKRVKRRLGITHPATLHGIRHRWGSAAIAAGAPLKLVSAQLGHASQVTTELYYVDLSNEFEAIRAAAELSVKNRPVP